MRLPPSAYAVPVRVAGFDLQFATNHLGHFALANLLLPMLTDRVVVVGSASHRTGTLDLDDLDDLDFERRGYAPYAAYGQSKLANLLFMSELHRRLVANGSTLRVTGAHPGYTATAIQSGTGSRFFTQLSNLGNTVLGMKPSHGALPILGAATLDVAGNSYLGPSGYGESLGRPTCVGRSRAANDPDLAARLWCKSESLSGVRFPL